MSTKTLWICDGCGRQVETATGPEVYISGRLEAAGRPMPEGWATVDYRVIEVEEGQRRCSPSPSHDLCAACRQVFVDLANLSRWARGA